MRPGEVGPWFRGRREHYGYMRSQVARSLWVHEATVGVWERGEREPSPSQEAAMRNLVHSWEQLFPESRMPPDMDDAAWGAWVQGFRVSRGWFMAQLGLMMGRTGGAVLRWERASTPVPRAVRIALWHQHLDRLGAGAGLSGR